MKLSKKCLAVILSSIMGCSIVNVQAVKGPESVNIDVGKIIKVLSEEKKPIGANTSFIMDSDIHRPRDISTQEQFKQMMLGSVRFPAGHPSNNYLWDDDGEYGGTLTPKVASLKVAPGDFGWATEGESRTLINDMDFDEYMSICNANGIEPFVVVNVMAHKYKESVTLDKLIESAAEWVKYSKEKGYDVKYWQIGNEQDHHANPNDPAAFPLEEYADAYKRMTAAMKAMDPSIKTGPGILSNTNWVNKIIEVAEDDVNFLSVHQYVFGHSWSGGGYDTWRNFRNMNDANGAVNNMNHYAKSKGLELFVTETNVYGDWPESVAGLNDTYRALALFEMQMHQISFSNVKHTYIWNTRSLWNEKYGEGHVDNLLWNDASGGRKANGEMVKIINENLHDSLVETSWISGTTRTYASYDTDDKDLTIFILNKDRSPVDINVNISNYNTPLGYERMVFKGTSEYDRLPTYTELGSINLNGDSFSTTLDPVSLTVIKFSPSLKAHWKLDNATSDNSGNGNHITALVNNPKFESSVLGSGLKLEDSQYAKAPFILNPAETDFSAAAWVKLDEISGDRQTIIQQEGSGSTWLFRDNGSNKLESWGGAWLKSNNDFPLNEWVHVAVTQKGNLKKLYMNGQLEAMGEEPEQYTSDGAIRIGGHKWDSEYDEEWLGQIDDVRVYSKELSQKELIQIMHTGTPEKPHKDYVLLDHFEHNQIGHQPDGWYVGEGGTALVDKLYTNQKKLVLTDTSDKVAFVSKAFEAQFNNTELVTFLQPSTLDGGYWLYINGTNAAGERVTVGHIHIHDGGIYAYDGKDYKVHTERMFYVYDINDEPKIVPRALGIGFNFDEQQYYINGKGFGFANEAVAIDEFAIQTEQWDKDYSLDLWSIYVRELPRQNH